MSAKINSNTGIDCLSFCFLLQLKLVQYAYVETWVHRTYAAKRHTYEILHTYTHSLHINDIADERR